MAIDYAAIKKRISVEQAIDALGIKITKHDNPDQLRAKCPACRNSDPRSLSMNTEIGKFTCFAARPNARGDVIALAAHVRGTGQKEAAEWLKEQFPEARPARRAAMPGNSSKVGTRKGKRTATKRLARPQLIQTQQAEASTVVQFKPKHRPKPEPVPAYRPEDDWTC